ncbi:hypothetical protein M440DRAFT_1397580 [Trichoderma longibrachiatum ATCC 18648]|uniref:C3H1-type domain-containing protein n=1 Tax=Trichoderma longibrachiatum ATCC 18648 TaxID=983965 RepID=A0A2T4CFE0_TRILO|nr:hypothetical protein M440DRAFT_1397580 [Trichoderma longibrachiatum ATCC 18648]
MQAAGSIFCGSWCPILQTSFPGGSERKSGPCRIATSTPVPDADTWLLSNSSLVMNGKMNRLASSTGSGHLGSAQDWRAATPCRFFQMGSCTKGSTCPFSHDKSIPIRSAPELQEVTSCPSLVKMPGRENAG